MDLTAPFVMHRSPSIHLVIEVTSVLANWLYGGNVVQGTSHIFMGGGSFAPGSKIPTKFRLRSWTQAGR